MDYVTHIHQGTTFVPRYFSLDIRFVSNSNIYDQPYCVYFKITGVIFIITFSLDDLTTEFSDTNKVVVIKMSGSNCSSPDHSCIRMYCGVQLSTYHTCI